MLFKLACLMMLGSLVPLSFGTTVPTYTFIPVAPAGSALSNRALSRDGNRLAFISGLDFTGENPDHSQEVFAYDLRDGSYTQCTKLAKNTVIFAPILSSDGNRVAFTTYGNLNGSNPNEYLEAYVYDLPTHQLTQITHTNVMEVSVSSMNRDGSLIAIRTYADLAGHNADRSYEIYLYSVMSHTFTQITDTSGLVSSGDEALLSDDGLSVIMTSYADLTGSGDNTSFDTRLYRYDIPQKRFTQLTPDIGDSLYSLHISGSNDLSQIALSPERTNASGGASNVILDTQRLTFTSIPSLPDSTVAFMTTVGVISRDGSKVGFSSTVDLAGTQGSIKGILDAYIYDADEGSLRQITHSEPGSSVTFETLNGDGSVIAVLSEGHLSSIDVDNPQSPYLYLGMAPPVPGDVNGDGRFDAPDLGLLLEAYVGLRPVGGRLRLAGDVLPATGSKGLKGDGKIGGDDLNWLIRQFLSLHSTS